MAGLILEKIENFFSSIRPQPQLSFPFLLILPLVINLIERTALLWLSTLFVLSSTLLSIVVIYLVSETVD